MPIRTGIASIVWGQASAGGTVGCSSRQTGQATGAASRRNELPNPLVSSGVRCKRAKLVNIADNYNISCVITFGGQRNELPNPPVPAGVRYKNFIYTGEDY